MKTKLLFLVLSIFIISSCCDFENDEYTYQKNAQLERILLFEAIDSKDPLNIVKEYEYDDEDRINKITVPFYQDGDIVGISEYNLYQYNSLGQLIEINNYCVNINSSTGFTNPRNYVYTYSNDEKKEKEYIEFPIIDSFEYSLFLYDDNNLIKTEKYGNQDELVYYDIYEYNDLGELKKETQYLPSETDPYIITIHKYVNGLNIKTDIFQYKDMKHAREIVRTFDKNDNLIILESNEIYSIGSMASHVLRYEYYED